MYHYFEDEKARKTFREVSKTLNEGQRLSFLSSVALLFSTKQNSELELSCFKVTQSDVYTLYELLKNKVTIATN
jgi:hypothetical protein